MAENRRPSQRYLSGRVRVTAKAGLGTDRHLYLSPSDAEPNLGFPGEKSVPISGTYYRLVTIPNGDTYDRYWQVDSPASLVDGISIFDEGTLVGTANSVSKINFVGSAITATSSGSISTITVSPPGTDKQILFNDLDDFGAASQVFYDKGNNRLGLGNSNPTQQLHISNDFRIGGMIWDQHNQVGGAGSVLIAAGAGVSWSRGSGANVTVSPTAPSGAVNGDLWWDSEDGDLNVYYEDDDNSAWVSANANADQEDGVWTLDAIGIHTLSNVGIGTTMASVALAVGGNAIFGGALGGTGIVTATEFHGTFVGSGLGIAGIGGTWASNIAGIHTTKNVGIGTDDPEVKLHLVGDRLQVDNTGNPFMGRRFNAGADGAVLFLEHSRSDTIGTKVKLNDNDEIGAIQFRGYRSDNSTITNAASIQAEVNGTPSANGVPADLIFNTGTTSAVAAERLRITSDGQLIVNKGNDQNHSTLILSKSDAGYAKLEFDVGTSQKAYVELDASEDLVHFGASGVSQKFYTNNLERLRITSDGAINIGGATTIGQLNVTGFSTFNGPVVDIHGQVGAARSVLTATGAGVSWGRGGSGVKIDEDAPTDNYDADLWWESDTGEMHIWYDDGSSAAWVSVSQGPAGVQGAQGAQGIQGAQGRQGAQGHQGVQGIQGAQGVQGAQGRQGAQGVAGPQGAQGHQGVQGASGNAGSQGVQGAQGHQGHQGRQGTAGTDGAQGVQGAQGHQGHQGVQGAQGHQGVDGTAGNPGSQGHQGVQGAEGNFGGATFEYKFTTNTADSDPGSGVLKLNNGTVSSATVLYIDDTDGGDTNTDIQPYLRTIDDSTSTIKGHFRISNKLNADDFALFTISSLVEATGYFKVTCAHITGSASSFSNNEDVIITFARTGDKGDAGAQGHQGVQGSAGAQGHQGVQGAQGHQGRQGAQGAQGSQGVQGAQGHQGHQGVQGAQGHQGHQGVQGDDGGNGAQGHQGYQGIQGAQGRQGAQGAQGAQGSPGTGGGDGAQGAQGYQGRQGSPGAQGAQGAPGSPAGNAGTATIRTESDNAYHNILFVDSTTDNQNQTLKMDNNANIFAWNPSINQLIANKCATSLMGTWSGSYGNPGDVLTSQGSGSSWTWTSQSNLTYAVPSGGIIIWSGAANAIPSGWVLCNGQNSTPNLSGRFVVGYSNNDALFDTVGETGGSKDAVVVSHTHNLNHNHTYGTSTSSDGGHYHYVMYAGGQSYGNNNQGQLRNRAGDDIRAVSSSYGTGNDPRQDAELGAATNAADVGRSSVVSGHAHNFNGTTAAFNGASQGASGGVSGGNKNLPPYYTLCYIMKT